MANPAHITHFGLPGIDRIPFGMHSCHLYSNRDQLVAALVPYFVAGLRGNERCLWITAPPLPASEAISALRDTWNSVDEAIQTGELRILDFDQWYASSDGLKGLEMVQLWLKEEECALDEGYNGLRIAKNTSFLKEGDWSTFMEYEQAVTAQFKNRRIIALCSYALTQCTDQQMTEVLHAHHGALKSSADDYCTMIYSEPGFEEDAKQSPIEHDVLCECVESETRFSEPSQVLPDELSSLALHSAREMDRPREAMRKSEERFRDMIDALPAAIYTTDAEGRLTHFNPAAVEFSGRVPELGTDQWCVSMKLYNPDGTSLPYDECPMAIALKEGRIVSGMEAIAERPDGTRVWFTPYPTLLQDAEGRIVGGINMLVDITVRKRADEALRETHLRLQRRTIELEQAVNIKAVELLQSQERLRALTTELNLTEHRERARLATELHDHLQQMLVLGKLKLGKRLAETVPVAAKLMREVDDVLSDALKYTRTLVTELSPPVLRDHGLPAGLTWLGEYMQKHDVTVTVTVPDEELQLPENQTVVLFQSVRELLINSSKHAGTGEATVAMEHSDGLLRIEVRDEGVGFNLAAVGKASAEGVSSKFGLFSIGERMRALGGSLEIESVPGKGTTATLILPLRTSDEWIVERGQRVVGREQKTAGAASAEGQVDREENVMGGERARAVHPNTHH